MSYTLVGCTFKYAYITTVKILVAMHKRGRPKSRSNMLILASDPSNELGINTDGVCPVFAMLGLASPVESVCVWREVCTSRDRRGR